MTNTMVFLLTCLGTSLGWSLLVLFLTTQHQRKRFALETVIAEKTTRLEMLAQGKSQWSLEFNQLAEQIFATHTAKSDQQVMQLLTPLKTQLHDFAKQLQDNYEKELKDKSILATEIKQLQRLNHSMTQETMNLTRALQGQNKMQGCWGELMLERALELSGLQQTSEYDLQVHLKDKSGQGFQPDAVVHLPGERDVIVDAKVSLTAYTRYVNAASEEEQQLALTLHH